MARSIWVQLAETTTGPTPFDTFPIPNPFTDIIETMYPFYFGPGIGTQTLEADDIAILSTIYPEPGFFANTGTIAGTIFAPNGSTKLTGVNVIARNVANPFEDAVSAISSDFTDSTSQADPVVGTYTINGLTPNADYAVFVDESSPADSARRCSRPCRDLRSSSTEPLSQAIRRPTTPVSTKR